MPPSTHGETLFAPKPRSASFAERSTTGLPPDLLNRVATRLQMLAWLYAFTFFMSAFFPTLIFPAERGILLESGWNWAPGSISIVVAVAVALTLRRTDVRPASVTASSS